MLKRTRPMSGDRRGRCMVQVEDEWQPPPSVPPRYVFIDTGTARSSNVIGSCNSILQQGRADSLGLVKAQRKDSTVAVSPSIDSVDERLVCGWLITRKSGSSP